MSLATPIPGPAGTRLTRLLGGFAAEVHKGLDGLRAGWLQIVIQAVAFPLFYLIVVLFMGRGQLRDELLIPVLFGMLALTVINEQVNRAFWGYLGDIQSGVLEQTYLTPLPSAALVLGRQVAAIVAALPIAAAVLLTGIVTAALRGGSIPFHASMIVPLATAVLGTCGLSLVLCGLTLAFKRIEIVTQVLVAVYAIVGGTLVPLASLPGWIATASRVVIPVAPAGEAIGDILAGATLPHLSTGWGLPWLLIQPVALIAVGITLFGTLQRQAKRRGTLGRY